jgi:hypothetical protein
MAKASIVMETDASPMAAAMMIALCNLTFCMDICLSNLVY